LQPDSLIPDPSNPQAYNRYSYVGNNPINFSDPTGHRACGDGEEYNCDGRRNKQVLVVLPKIPSWDPEFNVDKDDKAKAEAAYRHFLEDPMLFAGYFINPSSATEEYTYLTLFAEYSELHTNIDSLIWDAVENEYGVDAADRLNEAYWTTLAERSAIGISGANSDTPGVVLLAIIIAGRGNTGRTMPMNENEAMAMLKVMEDPYVGRRLGMTMGDSRWPVEEGWMKFERIYGGVKIHYLYSPLLDEFDDFKFK
jgi:hypothetical protein